jgi:hypothetical protein
MGTIIVEQFNPANRYWNKLYEVDEALFDKDAPITVDKYGGQYRTRLVGESAEKEKVEEKPTEKKFTKKKRGIVKGRFTRTVRDDGELDQI